MFKTEVIKLLIKQKGIIILIIFLGIKISFTISSGYNSDYIIDRNPEGYSKYINMYRGELTEGKKEKIENEYYKVKHSQIRLNSLLNDRKEGKISAHEYEEKATKYYERLGNSRVFGIIYNQYFYAKKCTELHYILDDRGWNTLLTNEGIDILLIFCVIILLTPIFCGEYECDMHLVILSTHRGKYQTCMVKIFLGLVIAVVITILFSLIEFISIYSMIGLDGWSYPLQSLPYFESSIYNISLIQAYIFVVLCRALATILLAIIVCLFEILLRKTIVALAISCIFEILPYLLFSHSRILYYLPVGLFIGSGYLRGTEYMHKLDINGTVESTLKFMQIETGVFMKIIFIYIIASFLIILFSVRKFSREKMNIRKVVSIFKKIKCIMIIMFLCLMLVGCKSNKDNLKFFYACSKDSLYHGETSKYVIDFNKNKQVITAEDKENNKIINIIRDPLKEQRYICGIFVHNNYCYYVEKDRGRVGFSVYAVNLIDFSKNLIFNNINENIEDFFGLISNGYNHEESLKAIIDYFGFFVDDEYIYCIDMMGHGMQYNIKTKKEKVIALDIVGEVYYFNGDLYYSNMKKQLCVFREKVGKVARIDEIYTEDFNIEDNLIKYKNLLDNNKVQYYKITN